MSANYKIERASPDYRLASHSPANAGPRIGGAAAVVPPFVNLFMAVYLKDQVLIGSIEVETIGSYKDDQMS